MISLVSAGKAQKGNFKYFVRWDFKKTGGRFFECNLLSYTKTSMGRKSRNAEVLAHDGDRGTYGEREVFKITDCPSKKGDHVIAYWDNRPYAFSGK